MYHALGMFVEAAFLPDEMKELLSEVGNLGFGLNLLGWDGLFHDCHEDIIPFCPELVHVIVREDRCRQALEGGIGSLEVCTFVEPDFLRRFLWVGTWRFAKVSCRVL